MQIEKLYQIFRESSGLSTDSRTLKPGQIFFALWGDNYNGNEFAANALKQGASWAVIDDPAYETSNTILVDDCLTVLQKLALFHRREINTTVLAITGTNGKTTSKDLASIVLGKKYKIHATKGNLNNQIGVPLTLLSAEPDTEIILVEMGASHQGEIRTLCHIAEPDYGIITNTGCAHIEGFGSTENIVKTKTELYEYLKRNNGIALYNDHDPVLKEKIYKMVNKAVPLSFPAGLPLTVTPETTDLYLRVNVVYRNTSHILATNIFGNHNIENVKIAVATGLFFEVGIRDIADAIINYKPENNRSQVRISSRNTVICDSYNANPTSMRLVLRSFAALSVPRKICILGDMHELGEKSEEEHQRVIELLREISPEKVFLVGPQFGKAGVNTGFTVFADSKALKEYITKFPLKGYHILVKGSRAMALEAIYDLL
ncbi:MAG: UDP-N-acetylmuramoyl-tripeptide--D-alanyl-D-alanine ligase [Bacteroidetes bacterium]|jgi:UDP-N-acetylmuramoyl-tripeptide--D-alanyl-D-alanine ligase|nr:UDP-N-acetylmuramoyl-tripeptide--D-alanyl-D-alanine ligase [Bacteroidota bacterium]